MLLKSPLLKIVGTSKKDCAFIRNSGAKIGDIVQFEYNISNIYSSIYITFVNKNTRYEVVTGPQSKQETFEL